MLVVGICAGPTDRAERIALPPLDEASLPVIVRRGFSSIFEAYNSIMEEAAIVDGFSGLILIHDEVELLDQQLDSKVDAGLRTADVLGVIGGVGLERSMDWAAARHQFGWAVDDRAVYDYGSPPPSGVDSVDGIFLALSPRACRELRFDQDRFDGFHGYDADICAQAKARGYVVGLVDVELRHHNGARKTDMGAYRESELRWMEKWRPGIAPVSHRLALRSLPPRLLRAAARRLRWPQ